MKQFKKSRLFIIVLLAIIFTFSSTTLIQPIQSLIIYFNDGFETFPTGWTTGSGGTGTITKDATHVNGGSWACKVYDTGDPSYAYAYRAMTEATGDYHVRIYLYLTGAVTYDDCNIIETYDVVPGAQSLYLKVDEDAGTIWLKSHTGGGLVNIKILTMGQYYKIDCYLDVSETEMDVYVDNIFAATVAIMSGDACNPDRVYVGTLGATQDGEYWIDDVLIDDDMTPPILPPNDPDTLFGAGFNASFPYVELHWDHSLVDVQFFEVQNSSDAVSWTYLGQSIHSTYTDRQVINGTEKYYRVRACNQTGGIWYNSSWSDVNFEKVYFIEGCPTVCTVDDYSVIFLSIGLIFMLIAYFLYDKRN